jgi:ferrochelatase
MNSPANSDVGVLLINLGTPDAPEPAAVRRYLAEFLSDPRVIEIPGLVWKPILYGVILRTRPAKSAEAYRQVWTDEGSPLMAISRRQAVRLRERLGDTIHVGLACVTETVDRRCAVAHDRWWIPSAFLLAPLTPILRGNDRDGPRCGLREAAKRELPAIRTLPPYFGDPLYIGALNASIERQLAALDFTPGDCC